MECSRLRNRLVSQVLHPFLIFSLQRLFVLRFGGVLKCGKVAATCLRSDVNHSCSLSQGTRSWDGGFRKVFRNSGIVIVS